LIGFKTKIKEFTNPVFPLILKIVFRYIMCRKRERHLQKVPKNPENLFCLLPQVIFECGLKIGFRGVDFGFGEIAFLLHQVFRDVIKTETALIGYVAKTIVEHIKSKRFGLWVKNIFTPFKILIR